MKTRLLLLAAFAAALFLGCLPEGVPPTGPDEDTSSSSPCESKSDDPSCQASSLPSSDDAVSSTDTNTPDPPDDPPPPDCSEVTKPFSDGEWIKCNTAPRCQIEWHNDPEWGCLASCWEIPNSPPPAIQDYAPQDFGTFTQCQPSP